MRSNLAARFGEFPGPSQRVNWGSGAGPGWAGLSALRCAPSSPPPTKRDGQAWRDRHDGGYEHTLCILYSLCPAQKARRQREQMPSPAGPGQELITGEVRYEAASQFLPRPPLPTSCLMPDACPLLSGPDRAGVGSVLSRPRLPSWSPADALCPRLPPRTCAQRLQRLQCLRAAWAAARGVLQSAAVCNSKTALVVWAPPVLPRAGSASRPRLAC